MRMVEIQHFALNCNSVAWQVWGLDFLWKECSEMVHSASPRHHRNHRAGLIWKKKKWWLWHFATGFTIFTFPLNSGQQKFTKIKIYQIQLSPTESGMNVRCYYLNIALHEIITFLRIMQLLTSKRKMLWIVTTAFRMGWLCSQCSWMAHIH